MIKITQLIPSLFYFKYGRMSEICTDAQIAKEERKLELFHLEMSKVILE